MARGPACSALILSLSLGACMEAPRAAGPNPPLFAVVCTPGDGGDSTTTMVTARAITVTPRPLGAELSWTAEAPGAEPVRTRLPPGQHCVIYRTI